MVPRRWSLPLVDAVEPGDSGQATGRGGQGGKGAARRPGNTARKQPAREAGEMTREAREQPGAGGSTQEQPGAKNIPPASLTADVGGATFGPETKTPKDHTASAPD